jgi:eukaryotic-like serine/threonine-protein kinase
MVAAAGAAGIVGRPAPWGVAGSGEGEVIADRYRLLSQLGSGAMGVVWQACDERFDRIVAIKLLVLPGGLSDLEMGEVTSRAMREGRITARVQHPNVVTVYDVVNHCGQPCLIMEYLPSRSLATVLSQHGVLAPDIVADLGSQIASGLAAAHRAGIVHRDIKPGNVLLVDDGVAKITDFGVSHAVGDGSVTAAGILAGTPAYLAPEVAQGHSGGFSSDVFSLASTLYTALEGAPPFGLSDNPIALLQRVATGKIMPPHRSGPLTPLLLRMLDRKPEQRPTMPQAQEMLATLAAGLAGSPGELFAPTLPLCRADPPRSVMETTQQTLSWSVAPEQVTTPLEPIRVEASTAGPPTTAGYQQAGAEWSAGQQLMVGAITTVLLTVSVLVTMLVGRSTVTNASGAVLASTAGTVADSIPVVPRQPAPNDPVPVITSSVPVTSGSSPDAEQLPQTITNYQPSIPGNPSAAGNRLLANFPPDQIRGLTKYQVQRRQSPRGPDRAWAPGGGWSGKHRHGHHRH